ARCDGGSGTRPGAVRDALHEAFPLEDDALVDLERRGRDVALHLAGSVDLDRPLGADVADDQPLHDDLADVDLGVDLRALADDEHVVGEDLARDLPVDADRALERELALELASFAEEGVDLAHDLGSLRYRHGHTLAPRARRGQSLGPSFASCQSSRRNMSMVLRTVAVVLGVVLAGCIDRGLQGQNENGQPGQSNAVPGPGPA